MLMNVVNTRLETTNPAQRSQAIDLAILQFFDQFRKIYIGDQGSCYSYPLLRLFDSMESKFRSLTKVLTI